MIIEKMRKEHIGAIAEIEKCEFGLGCAEKTLLKELENKIATYFVATENNEVLGYIGIWNICGEGEVINTAVLKNKRRLGIGTRLLNEAFSFCRENGIKTLHLEVRKSNTPAISLYEKLGFIKDGERKNYYDGIESAILMSRNCEG